MLDTAQVSDIKIISGRKVIFIFHLPNNESLRDIGVVHSGMSLYLLKYPNVDSYTTEYYGDWLFLTVMGTVNINIFR